MLLDDNGDPLFHATYIGSIFDIQNIHTSIVSYYDNEKLLLNTYTPTGLHETIFLTELGLYKIDVKTDSL